MSLPHFRRFARETGVFGLHLFKEKRSTFDALFWGTFVAVFGCYTAKSLVVICEGYLAEATITKVQQSRVEHFPFPAPQFCFMANPVGDVPTDMGNINAILKAYTDTGDLNGSAFLSARYFVHLLAHSELAALPPPSSQAGNTGDFQSVETFASNLNGSSLATALDAFANRSARMPQLLSNFSDFVHLKLCRGLDLSVSFYNATANATQGGTIVCRRPNVGFVPPAYENTICVDLDGVMVDFQDRYDVLTVAYNTSAIAAKLGIAALGVWIDNANHFLASDYDDMDAMFNVDEGRRREYNFRVSARYEKLQLRRRPCDDDQTWSKRCEGTCNARYFFNSFGCWPMFYVYELAPPDIEELRRCEADDYLNVNASTPRWVLESFTECLGRCLPACTKTMYLVTPGSWTESEVTVATVRVISHVFMLVEEELASDFEGLLSDFGGALGLWLGANFACVVHVPIFVLQMIVEWIAQKRKGTLAMAPHNSAPKGVHKANALQSISAEFAKALAKYEALERRVADETAEMTAKFSDLEKSLSEVHVHL